ncbi:methyltransferase domain protein [Leptospira weilii serovar Ranarum str. ICFT]|uniref:Methyltransferase domain protein n=1 Tax=Leptospira weilii serovar Ranarum str. ICFT TaxID=1218598 RepID=N1WDE9_9LEPT|nr:class I SAM-dependent methyltransferase [Leptospira weilii]EMY76950.1 methyltransferase domain protein [Leptospira weilii serovar Ranarum str. ICFT]
MQQDKFYIDLGLSENQYSPEVIEGQQVYTPSFLRFYDLIVLHIISRWFWRCPSQNMIDLYNKNLSANHLDIGVGTGYLLQNATFPVAKPALSVMDLNPNSLIEARRRLSKIAGQFNAYRANILEPINTKEKFDSIGLSFLFHCVPGPIRTKASTAFKNLIAIRKPGGVIFGTTALHDLGQTHYLSRRGMKNLNREGVFHNTEDTFPDLEAALKENFEDYELYVIGAIAFFVGRKAK